MPTTYAVIAARGGSKGIPGKNLLDLCGKPLLVWSIEHAREAAGVDRVIVSSDSPEILKVAEDAGASGVLRPAEISGDVASSESAWIHALDAAEARFGITDRVVALQATSPIRQAQDIADALRMFDEESFDSLLSVNEVEDFFTWKLSASNTAESVNYDWRDRRRRQEIEPRYLENGSFYIFSPELLRQTGNRLGGRIGLFQMSREKMFQIDRPEDIALCAAILRGYGYA